ncbi:MAG: TonB-dependent receptor [Acidobacteriota bacterium]|nr:TonB-dependent receptor [Acidobacteriota bacterium]
MSALRTLVIALALVAAVTSTAAAQVVQGTGAGSTLRVTVLDQTEAALIIAQVTLVDSKGVEQTMPVDERGVAEFTALNPGSYQVKASAESFRTLTTPYNVRQGRNQTTLRLALATIEQTVIVEDQSAADRRDNGFTQTLTQDEIDALPDDPDEMAEELARIAGPGAQIFVDGFRGGRLPPKDQIQQIRFHTNSFSAEYHEAGMIRVEVITKPGMGGWRGNTNFGFRDESLNSKQAFANEKGPEQMRRYMVNFQGPIAKGKTGLSLTFDGNSAYDSRTIVADAPAGQVNALAVAPTDAMNFSARVEHLLGGSSQLRMEYARRQNERSNIGVGDFDLPERAYATDNSTDTFRLRNTRVIGKKVFSELLFEFNDTTNATRPGSILPTIRVNDAFTAGGAGQSGDRNAREIQIAQNFDFTLGRKHSFRAGVLLESGWWNSTQRSNANGTYTFTSLDAYPGTPATYTIRVGDPLVNYSQTKAGWFLQDDFRPSRTLQLSFGLRQEIQTHVDSKWNLAPRAAFTWNATKKTTMRGGYGIFYDWYESNLYEQTIRVDGNHQVDQVIQNPGFPVAEGGGTRLPASVIRSASLGQPIIQQASFGLERPLAPWADFRADYMWTRGSNMLRSINVNAPAHLDGVRPNLLVGNITEVQSSGKRASDRVAVALNARYIPRRILGMVMYQFGGTRNYADGPTALPSDSNNPNQDWGPSAQDVRHRIFFNFNAPLGRGIRAGLNVQGSSALPYNITTGFDANGDTVFNDRPAGVERNSARGAAQWNSGLRLNKSIGLGGLRAGAPGMPGMPPPPPPPPGGAAAQRGPGGPGGGGGDGPQMVVMEGGGNQRYRLDLYVNFQNLFNKVNYNAFVGNQLSRYFGAATSAGAPRRIEIGASLGF